MSLSYYPPQSGSNQKEQRFSLTKSVISNQSAKNRLTDFNEVIISEEKYDSKKIKGIYNDLFYLISKKGKKSHTSIIEQSTDYVYPEININLEDEISAVEEELANLNDLFLSGSFPQITPQHPIYDNGVLIQNGDTLDNVAIDPSSTIFYIQQGFKRPITHSSRGYYVRLLRQVEGEIVYNEDGSIKPLNLSPNFRYLSTDELNEIPNGEEISSAASLNLKTITDQGANYIYDEIEILLGCRGVEEFYRWPFGHPLYSQNIIEGYPEKGGYWWIDKNASCKVKVVYPNLSAGWRTIPAFTDITIKISRDDQFYGHELGGTTDPLDYNFYLNGEGITEKVLRNGYGQALPPLWKEKRWGEGSPFPTVTEVKPGSRLTYRVKGPYNSSGNVVDGGESHWFNKTSPNYNQEGIFTDLFNAESTEGTQMINKECSSLQNQEECFGNLGQSDELQKLFNKPDFNYYKKAYYSYSGDGYNIKVYGQPILKVEGDYSVFGYRYRSYGVDWNVFYNLESGATVRIKNKHLDDDVSGYKRSSKKYFDWTPEDYGTYVNNPTLYFPGIQGVKVNSSGAEYELLNGDRTFNNPGNNGSNDKVTNWMKENLKRG